MDNHSQGIKKFTDVNLNKLARVKEKFDEIVEGEDVEIDGKNYKTEILANRFYDFYIGVERIFKRIAQKIDGEVPRGADWHKKLLKQMTEDGFNREAVISEELRKELMDFLVFRHFWVKSYVIELDRKEMEPLIDKFDGGYEKTRRELLDFVGDMAK